jgi:hypothetical protein
MPNQTGFVKILEFKGETVKDRAIKYYLYLLNNDEDAE